MGKFSNIDVEGSNPDFTLHGLPRRSLRLRGYTPPPDDESKDMHPIIEEARDCKCTGIYPPSPGWPPTMPNEDRI